MVKLRAGKGQFMLISAVVIGMIIMTMASSISEITSQEFEPNPTKYEINMIKDKTEKLNLERRQDRERLERTLSITDSYNSEMTYWDEEECVNITLRRRGEQYDLNCIKGGLSGQLSGGDIIENFENGLDHYSGDTEDYSTTQSPVYSGGYALTTESTDTSYIFTDEPENLPERGDIFYGLFRTDTAEGYGEMYFAASNGNRENSYFIRVTHRDDGRIQLYKNVNGNPTLLGEDSFNRYQMAYQWNFIEVNFGNTTQDTIDIAYYSEGDRNNPQASFSVTDSQFDSGSIGWSLYDDSGGTTNIHWDYMRYPEDE